MNETVPNCLPHLTAFMQQHKKSPPVLRRTGNCFPSSFCLIVYQPSGEDLCQCASVQTHDPLSCNVLRILRQMRAVPSHSTHSLSSSADNIVCYTTHSQRKQEKGKRPLRQVGVSTVPRIKSGREPVIPLCLSE